MNWRENLEKLRVWIDGEQHSDISENVIKAHDNKSAIRNLRLPTENRKISHTNAEINLEENNNIWITALHKNPTIVSGKAIRNGEKAKLGADHEIQIYDFRLRLKFVE